MPLERHLKSDLRAAHFGALLTSSSTSLARTRAGDWLSVKAKGRSYGPSPARLAAAKNEAQTLASVNGAATKREDFLTENLSERRLSNSA